MTKEQICDVSDHERSYMFFPRYLLRGVLDREMKQNEGRMYSGIY